MNKNMIVKLLLLSLGNIFNRRMINMSSAYWITGHDSGQVMCEGVQ
jgi:hypothetical protein